MTLTRTRLFSVAGIVGGTLVVYALLTALLARVAHADTGTPPAPGWSLAEILLLIGVILFAARQLVDGLRAVFHFLGARNPATTWVDGVATTLDSLHDRITALEALIPRTPGPIDPGTTVTTTTVKRDPQAGKANLGTLATLALGSVLLGTLVGFSAVGISSGCATVRPAAGSAVAAELDCSSAAMVDVARSLGNAAQTYLVGKIAGDGRTVDTAAIKADLRALGSKAWSCAITVALNVVLGQPTARTSIAHAAAAPGPDWRAVLVEVKGELGVTAVRLPTGEVL
jgi:hypothetical protein